MSCCFNTQTLSTSENDTLLCLIPKFTNENHLKNFRSISLFNSTNKISIKIIANRLKPLLTNLISPYQSSFLKGYRTCDNVILVQELMNTSTTSNNKVSSFILELDMEKAFDRFKWSFVYRSLLYFKFLPKITTLIMNCISTKNIAILVNGTPKNYFSSSKDIIQGDPMSPYIFILCMDLLANYITHQVDNLCWNPITLSQNGPSLSHLLFTDDLMFSSRPTTKSILTIHY